MKKLIFLLSLFICASLAAQNTHVAPTGTPSPSALGSNLHHYGRVFNVLDYGADNTGVADATVAIQAAINACDAAGGGTVYFPSGIYKIAGALQTSVGGANPNCQIYIPSHSYTSGPRNSIRLVGESVNGFPTGYSSIVNLYFPTTGAILKSTLSSASGTTPSVIGTKDGNGNYSSYNYTDIYFQNLFIQTYTNHGAAAPVLSGVNLLYAAKVSADKLIVGLDTSAVQSHTPASSEVAGIIEGHLSNDGPNVFTECFVYGYKYGWILSEHTEMLNCFSIANYYGYVFQRMDFTVNGFILVHACPHGLFYPTSAMMGIDIGQANTNLTVEVETDSTVANGFGSLWYKTLDQITDASNYGHGIVRIRNIQDGGGGQLAINTPGSNLHALAYDDYIGGSSNDIQFNSSGSFAGGGPTYSSNTMAITKNVASSIGYNAINSNAGGAAFANVQNDQSNQIEILIYGSSHAAYGSFLANSAGVYASTAHMIIGDDNASGNIDFSIGTTIPKVYTMNATSFNPAVTATNDLGTASLKFRDLYVIRNISVGGNFTLATAGSSFNITEGTDGRVGQVALVTGTKAITITGLTTSSRAFVTLVTPNTASSTIQYKAVCTSNTLTITALIAAGTVNASDISTLNYFVIN